MSFLISGCKKEFSPIGLDIQPPNDKFKIIFDSVSRIESCTFLDDSVVTDESTGSAINLLGSYQDPVFGITEAGFFSQFILNKNNVSFGKDVTPDSIILTLDYFGYYGDTSTQQTIRVFRLDESIYRDSTYYADIDPSKYIKTNQLLAEMTYYPKPKDSLLEIPLVKSLAEDLLYADTADLKSDEAFLKFFKGLYISVEPVSSGGAIVYFNMMSQLSKLTLYYSQTDTSNNKDTVYHRTFPFVVKSNCARINRFKHDYSSTSFFSHLNDTTYKDSVVYLQTMAGLKTKIHFPDIVQWKDSSVAVNKAELILPIEKNDLSLKHFRPPGRIFLVALTEDGKYEFLSDYSVDNGIHTNDQYFNGYYDSISMSYTFQIAHYMQQIISGEKNYSGLFLFSSKERTVSANRVVLTSAIHSRKMKLLITYTKL